MGRKRILVVDDEAVIREGMRRILDGGGFTVETFANGYLAIEKLQAEAFDLLITDLKMPGMSGMDVLDQIKAINPKLPVIIITGFVTDETTAEIIKRGARNCLPKPFNPEQLRNAVKNALENSRLFPAFVLVFLVRNGD